MKCRVTNSELDVRKIKDEIKIYKVNSNYFLFLSKEIRKNFERRKSE